MEKPCLTKFKTIIYWNRSLAASDLFHMIKTQLIKLYAFHCHILKGADVCKKVIQQVDKIWTVDAFSDFKAKLEFTVTITANFERFQYFTFESTKIENPTFPCKLPCQKLMLK